jgi:hypothetical protein
MISMISGENIYIHALGGIRTRDRARQNAQPFHCHVKSGRVSQELLKQKYKYKNNLITRLLYSILTVFMFRVLSRK